MKPLVRFASLLALLCFPTLLIPAPAVGGVQIIEGCVDARGAPVVSVEDDALPRLALAAAEDGRPVLRYNPGVLPRLSIAARAFFYAHECARLSMDMAPGAARTLGAARRADCQALAALRQSNILDGDAAMSALLAELRFTDAEWSMIPGPSREFQLAGCPMRGALRLPAAGPPSEASLRHDRCVHACGDSLWQCQQRCRGTACRDGCEAAFGRCETACAPP
jgi:hypothetical protein